jgi:hypothetical protein
MGEEATDTEKIAGARHYEMPNPFTDRVGGFNWETHIMIIGPSGNLLHAVSTVSASSIQLECLHKNSQLATVMFATVNMTYDNTDSKKQRKTEASK